MSSKPQLVWFEQVTKEDVGLVGGKGANLGEMTNAHLPIPYGFVVTSQAYFDYIEHARLQSRIKDILSITNVDSQAELHSASQQVQRIILGGEVPTEISRKIVEYYEKLPEKEEAYFRKELSFMSRTMHAIRGLYKQPLVAVRSSATAEDLPDASFAGQQETYLNVQGEAALLKKVKECWASLFTERAIYYREQKGFDHFQVGLAAVIQRMVQSTKSGIAFSIDPVTNDKKKIVIEAIFGLGEYIVQGKVTPDHYEVDKNSFVILNSQVNYQNLKLVKSGRGNTEVKLSKAEGSVQKLTEEEVIKVALLVKDIEKHYFFPQDIEWAIEGDRVFIVQSRPITTIAATDSANKSEGVINSAGHKLLVSGAPASPGIGSGVVKVIFSPDQIDEIKKGDVLVAPQTNPDYVPAMKRAAAIVTDKGGRTSHAAIVSRELGIPAVVGTENATKVLKNGMVVSVVGSTGEIFEGKLDGANVHKKVEKSTQSTKVHVYLNTAEPEAAKRLSEMNVDGVGLLRAEFMIAAGGVHPKEYIRQKNEKQFVDRLAKNLEKFTSAFNPRPVVYRATDFKSNEYRNLKGGEKYEPKEENPMIGYRGASRYIVDKDVFSLELQAFQKIWGKGYKNLHLMIPFVRVPYELIQIKEMIQQHGLFDYPEFKLWIMVEVPAAAIMLEELIKIGFDGVSIGTNDLTMMLLGVDRDSEKVSGLYDERNPAVVQTLVHIVKTCKKHGVTCSICGEAASNYPDLVEKLVRTGITSVSVNADVADKTRDMIHKIESEMEKE
ncbi:MAG: phosphoenolpyruvate synthase [Patescibacteria group bacterium]|nr:phosphoenolpyruvate synthase [Patescibacteria group bacterium]